MIEYEQIATLPPDYVKGKIKEFLEEDIPAGDITTSNTINQHTISIAQIQVASDFIFSGEYVIPHCFPEECVIDLNKKDGDQLTSGEILGLIKGHTQTILTRERVMLNLIQRLCGIATITRRFTELANPHDVKILDTRKTTPGLRLFEKYAVKCGGGWNHRLDLSSGILIKDNHLQASGSVQNAVRKLKKTQLKLPIELEVDTLTQIEEGLKIDVDGYLLDNMTPDKIEIAVKMIRSTEKGGDIFIEASGGITLEKLPNYLDTGINAISTGAITHSAQNADIRLEFI